MASAWSQLDQLLTCAICLDRYRNPKLLPCQHTFCMDPCLEGLIDYARRQIKCPECRAEHRIPYQGVQAFPTNVTLMRFLELHRDITGEEPEPSPSMMERCNVCSEKSYLDRCAHCDKKICQDCKEAHVDVLRREISRINNQVRRGLHRLNDALTQTQKNAEKLQLNCRQVKEEIEELVRRYTKDLLGTEEKLKHDLDVYIQNELRNVVKLKDDLDSEVSNMTSNCELVDKYLNDNIEWTDAELVEYKEVFLKTLDFLRSFDSDTSDFARRVKFQPRADPDVLHRTLAEFAELKINAPAIPPPQMLVPPPSNALMRSQSDHRLAAQFQRRQENRSFLDINQRFGGHASDSERDTPGSPLFSRGRRDISESGYRRYGDRSATRDLDYSERDTGRSRFLREEGGYQSSRWRDQDSDFSYRSRYSRDVNDEADVDSPHPRTVRFEEPPQQPQRERILQTDDATKGPLSGVIRLIDSPHVMERLHQHETRQKQQQNEKDRKEQLPPTPPQPPPRRPPSRQISEDEIEKQKKQNQQASTQTAPPTRSSSPPSSQPTPVATTPQSPAVPETPYRPLTRRVAALQKEEDTTTKAKPSEASQKGQHQSPERVEVSRQQEESPEAPSRSRRRQSSSSSSDSETSDAPEPSLPVESPRQLTRSASPAVGKSLPLEQEDRREDLKRNTPSRSVSLDKKDETRDAEDNIPAQSSFYSRLIGQRRPPEPEIRTEPEVEEDEEDEEDEDDEGDEEIEDGSDDVEVKEEEFEEAQEESGSDSESEVTSTSSSSSSSSDSEVVTDKPKFSKPSGSDVNSSTLNSLLDRSKQARRNTEDFHQKMTQNSRLSQDADTNDHRNCLYRNKRDEGKNDATYTAPSYGNSVSSGNKRSAEEDGLNSVSQYGRYQGSNRSSAVLSNANNRDDSLSEDTSSNSTDSRYGNQLHFRGKGSSGSRDPTLSEESEEEDDKDSSPVSTHHSRYERPSDNLLVKSRSHHAIKSRDRSPDDNTSASTAISNNSSWAKYLRNKYGSGGNGSGRNVARSRSSHAIYTCSGSESSEDEDNSGRNDSILSRYGDNYNFASPRCTYLQKRRMAMKIGCRGTESGCFTWPRGVAVGPENSIVVADSSNHRVQVFDENGKFLQEFGIYGSGEGEFDCLAGVAVNRIGQFIVSDRYNHRIQVFDPSGRFLRAFGCEGRLDGRFNYPWGITTDSLGFIYVCDKENHRIQVFQSDGTFVGKFGSMGSRPGQLEHPHYIAVSNTNRVVVSDSNNHRIQIFDVNGRSLSTFGSEGPEDGQFKFPRGVAVDDQGYIIVGDSGNNRIQIFHPDGTFLKCFGSWGPGEGEFKGLEGISVMPNGNILVCDRENHRIQVF